MARSNFPCLGRYLLVLPFVTLALASSSPVQAQESCSVWKLSGPPVSLRQSDGAVVQLMLGRKGSVVSGHADYFRSYVGKILGILSKGVDVNMVGKVDGVLAGSRLDFKIKWDNLTIGIYELSIDKFGRITGTSHDFENPSNRVNIIGDKPLSCFRK